MTIAFPASKECGKGDFSVEKASEGVLVPSEGRQKADCFRFKEGEREKKGSERKRKSGKVGSDQKKQDFFQVHVQFDWLVYLFKACVGFVLT